MTFEVQQNRWDQLIRRTSGSIGPGSRVGETLAELFPVFEVETNRAELMLLAGWTLGQGAAVLNASVGDRNQAQLFNPTDSGKLVVLEQVMVGDAAAPIFEYNTSSTALADDVGNVIQRDTRDSTPPVGQIRTVQQPGGLPTIGIFNVQASIAFTLTIDGGLFVLAPGTGFNISTDEANTNTRFNFMWRERVALESELSF